MVIFCNHLTCKYNKKLDKPLFFYDREGNRRNNSPFGWEDKGECYGKCIKDFCGFEDISVVEKDVKHNIAICSFGETLLCKKRCVWNNKGKCTREEIFVERKKINGVNYWVCELQGQIGISGHIDFSRFGKKKDMF